MREILFRGKSIYTGEWITGYYIGTGTLCKYGDEHWNVDYDTVGQYTGMKDKHGNKIFEGDIVALDEDVKETFDVDDGEVRWGWGGFYVKEFSTLNSLNALASYVCILRGEVIGNIHDNPELLDN